jgi:hypothetical protein
LCEIDETDNVYITCVSGVGIWGAYFAGNFTFQTFRLLAGTSRRVSLHNEVIMKEVRETSIVRNNQWRTHLKRMEDTLVAKRAFHHTFRNRTEIRRPQKA